MNAKEYQQALSQALETLRKGGVILYPTDTVWGLGCDATDPQAVARIYEIKQRADSKALVLLASDLDMVCRYVYAVPEMAEQLVEINDRPMTIIYPSAVCAEAPARGETPRADRHRLAWNVVAEDGSVGIRIPQSAFCHDLAYKLGRPIVSTSANISGDPSPRRFTDIPQALVDAVDCVVDARLEKDATGQPSQILKIGLDGQVEIIRA